MELTLYFAPGSCAFASLVGLEEAEAQFHAKPVMFAQGEQRSPSYLAINPRGRVPALQVGDRIITESIAILGYIADRFDDRALLPHEPLARAKAYEMLATWATGAHIEVAKMWRTERFTDDPVAQESVKESGRVNYRAALDEIEGIAAASPDWLAGPDFGVVDAFSIVLWRWAQRLELDMARYPAWGKKIESALERPAVIRAIERERATVAA
jgi:glutathione S-transferase